MGLSRRSQQAAASCTSADHRPANRRACSYQARTAGTLLEAAAGDVRVLAVGWAPKGHGCAVHPVTCREEAAAVCSERRRLRRPRAAAAGGGGETAVPLPPQALRSRPAGHPRQPQAQGAALSAPSGPATARLAPRSASSARKRSLIVPRSEAAQGRPRGWGWGAAGPPPVFECRPELPGASTSPWAALQGDRSK